MLPDWKRFNLGYIGAAAALEFPEAPAVIDLHGGGERVFTYAELDRRLDRMAALLGSFGLAPGARVALLVGNRFEFVETVYGALRAGLVPVMINTKLGLHGLQQSIEEVAPDLAVIDTAVNSAGREAANSVRHRLVLGGADASEFDYFTALEDAPSTFDPPRIASTDNAELCFTSGSTGRPKAVVLSHRALLLKYFSYGNNHRAAVGGAIRSLVHLPIFHANGRASIALAFGTGGTIVI